MRLFAKATLNTAATPILYQMASGEGRGAFYDAPVFHGATADAPVSSDSLTCEGMDKQPGVAQFPGGETIPPTADMPDNTVLSGDSMAVPPDMGTFPASGEAPQSGGFLHGENGEMFPDANADSGIGPCPIGTAPDAAGATFEEGMHFAGAVPGQFPDSPSVGSSSESYGSAPQEAAQNVYAEAPLVAATFPGASEGTMLRTVGEGVIEANSPDGGNTLWYNSAFYQEPDAPHSTMEAANGVQWYAMQPHADAPQFETGDAATSYNQAAFQNFMPGYDLPVSQVDGQHRQDGHFEVRHEDGSGTKFYDTARYAAPRGDYQVYEDAKGSQWYTIRGEAAVERKPVYENGKPVYDGENFAPSMWRPSVTSRRRPVLQNPKSAAILPASPQEEKCNMTAMIAILPIMAVSLSTNGGDPNRRTCKAANR